MVKIQICDEDKEYHKSTVIFGSGLVAGIISATSFKAYTLQQQIGMYVLIGFIGLIMWALFTPFCRK